MCRAAGLALLLILLCAACATDTPPTPDVTRLLDEGRAHLALYEWDRAIAALNEAISAAPDNAEGYCLRGLAYASSNGGTLARDAAITDYARCLELAPDRALADLASQALTVLRAAAEQ
ncbi:MAG: tetratricopeptide repeat protein [Anaerolineae bacterium]|nr:tetratricopeptide repeat protein [Anaerolineae bacterium]